MYRDFKKEIEFYIISLLKKKKKFYCKIYLIFIKILLLKIFQKEFNPKIFYLFLKSKKIFQ